MTHFIFPLRVYVEDTDYSGMVFHANYLNFFERARTEWMLGLGLGVAWQEQQEIYFAIRSAKLEYIKPARLCDQLEVVSRITEQRRVSLTFEQYLRLSNQPDTILCTAEIKVACLGYDFRPKRMPPCKLHDILMGEPE